MTVNWYRPSQCVLILVTVSSIVLFLGCLACGFLLYFAPEEPSKDVNGGIYINIPAFTLLGAALAVIVCLILGCCGVCKDSKLTLLLYSVLSIVVAAVVLGSTTTAFTFTMKGTIENKLSEVLLWDLEHYSENDTQSPNAFNTVQDKYQCCGVNGYSDWREKNTTWKREAKPEAEAPKTCCMKNATEGDCNHSHSNLNNQGCLKVLVNRMKPVIYAVFGFSVAVAALQIVTALFTCYGARLIRRYQSYDVL